MLEHFESVTEMVLKTISTVVTLLGVAGIVTGFISVKTIYTLQTKTRQTEERIANIHTAYEELVEQLDNTKEAAHLASGRLQYLLEARDLDKNVRLRAVQKLSRINDLSVVSMLIERLSSDENAEVRAEAAFGIGTLFAEKSEIDSVEAVFEPLIEGTKDNNESVRYECTDALNSIVSGPNNLSRMAIRRLEQLAIHDPDENIRKKAEETLANVKLLTQSRIANG